MFAAMATMFGAGLLLPSISGSAIGVGQNDDATLLRQADDNIVNVGWVQGTESVADPSLLNVSGNAEERHRHRRYYANHPTARIASSSPGTVQCNRGYHYCIGSYGRWTPTLSLPSGRHTVSFSTCGYGHFSDPTEFNPGSRNLYDSYIYGPCHNDDNSNVCRSMSPSRFVESNPPNGDGAIYAWYNSHCSGSYSGSVTLSIGGYSSNSGCATLWITCPNGPAPTMPPTGRPTLPPTRRPTTAAPTTDFPTPDRLFEGGEAEVAAFVSSARMAAQAERERYDWQRKGGDVDGEAAGDRSGVSVALSLDGLVMAIGGYQNDGTDSNAGHVRVWAWHADGPDDGEWRQRGQDIDGEAYGDNSGFSVSLSEDGNTLAVGAYANDNAGGVNAGHVRVWQWDASRPEWNRVGADIDGDSAGDNAGYAVALSGDGQTLAVGAYNTNVDGVGASAGMVRVFRLDTQMTVAGTGTNCDCHAPNYPGSGSWHWIVDQGHIQNSCAACKAGVAGCNCWTVGHCHELPACTAEVHAWVQYGRDIKGEREGDNSGVSVDLNRDGSVVAIGAFFNDDSGDNAGHARVLRWSSVVGEYLSLGETLDGDASGDRAGVSVSLSADGDTVAVGAYHNDGNGNNAGHVKVYRWIEGQTEGWEQLGYDLDGESANDHSGISVSLSADGNTIAIGATHNDGSGHNAGHVRVSKWWDTRGHIGWEQLGTDIDGEAMGDNSGRSVALNGAGDVVSIGAYHNDGNGASAGHVRSYRLPASPAPTSAPTSYAARTVAFPFTMNSESRQIKIVITNNDAHVLKIRKARLGNPDDVLPYVRTTDGEFADLSVADANLPSAVCNDMVLANGDFNPTSRFIEPGVPNVLCGEEDEELFALICNRRFMGVYHANHIDMPLLGPKSFGTNSANSADRRRAFEEMLPVRNIRVFKRCQAEQ